MNNKLKCNKCEHKWNKRTGEDDPLSCPKCKRYDYKKKNARNRKLQRTKQWKMKTI